MVNHQEYITQISKALAQIAAVLPRVNVKILLFPTEEIKRAVSTLYANVLRFMVRAMKWYTEGKFKHFITAVFRPAPLRFGDILEGVETLSKMIDELAVGASQAEQRNMHVLLQEIKRTMAGGYIWIAGRLHVLKFNRKPSSKFQNIFGCAKTNMRNPVLSDPLFHCLNDTTRP